MGFLKSSKDGLNAHQATAAVHAPYTLPELAPMERIRELLENLFKVIQIPVGLVAPDSTLLMNIGWQPICEHFHRGHPESSRCCLESNKLIQSRLAQGTIAAEKCANGLWDIAMPIMVEGQQVATLFIGQFLYDDEQVDLNFFKTQARRYGYDESAYLAALAQVPRISRDTARRFIDYSVNLLALLAESGYKNKLLAQEVEERRLAEYALREGERQYRALVENVPGAVYLCLNDDAFTTIFISDAIEMIAGYSARCMIDEAASIAALIHPDDVERVHQEVDAGLRNRQPYTMNYRLRRKDGAYMWVEEYGQGVYDEADTLRFLQGVIFDVTDRRRMEEERRRLEAQMARAQKLESLGIMAGGIAHDFNNLLVGILGHADLAMNDIEPDCPARESLMAIIQAARRAADLTRQMLAYSGKGHFLIEPVDLAQMVDQSLPGLRELVKQAVIVEHERAAPTPQINGDTTQLNQLLANLVTNAAEAYGDAPGRICIRTGAMHCDQTFIEASYHNELCHGGLHAYIEVVDQGCGMTEETRRRLCDPFFSTKFPGRGLGMATVIGIVRGHQGLIAVESAPGWGTRIQALFPVGQPTAPEEKPALSAAENAGGSILLVDDEEIVRNVAGKMLRRAGYRVLIADSGAEAVRLVREQGRDIACVILDLTMPGMDGETTFHEIRKINSTVPIVLSSGYSREDALSRLANHTTAAFLQKPYEVNALTGMLKHLLRNDVT